MQRRTFLQSTAGLAAVASGCSGYTGNEPAGTVELYSDHRLYERREAVKRALHDAGLPDSVTVELVEPSFLTVARRSRFQQWLNAQRETPALLLMDGAWMLQFAREGLIEPFGRFDSLDVSDAIRNDCFEAAVVPALADDELYGLPLFSDAGGVFYRRDLFREAGYDPDLLRDDPPEWRRFASVVADVRDATDTAHGYGFQAQAYEGLSCCVFREVLAALGGGYFGSPTDHATGPVGDRPVTVDTDPVRRTLELFRGLVHGEGAPDTASVPAVSPTAVFEWTEEPSREAFAAGDLVAHRNWRYVIGRNGTEGSFGSDLGLAPLPRGVPTDETDLAGTGGSRSTVGSRYVVPNPHAPRRKRLAAGMVLNAMHTPTFRRRMFQAFEVLPPTPELYSADELRESRPFGRYLDTYRLLLESGVPRPVTRIWSRESRHIAEHLDGALRGDRGVDSTLERLQSKLETLETEAADG